MELLKPLSDATFAGKSVAFTGTAGTTATWPAGPEGVVVWADAACYVLVSEGGTAATATNGTAVPANTPIPFFVPRDKSAPWAVSAVQISTGGTVYAKPINTK
jgi:hypothetical protein